ncbi:MAG: endolytic transglycosylase MltG [Candidatus Paceibacterota bacterium]|jgi:UPF0755 protein
MRNKILILLILGLFLPLFVGAQSAVPAVTTIEPTAVIAAPILDKFVVPLNATQDVIIQSLLDQGFITDKDAFIKIFAQKKGDILPGAYKLTLGMSPTAVAKVLHSKPYMAWVVIPPGLRKEEIADLLAKNLNWTKTGKTKWLNSTKLKYDYMEGVYFPDTYLIPVAETPSAVAKRLTAKFNEKFAPYLPQFTKKNMKWTTGLTLASIVQREAANDADMPLVAGILLNRLNQKMPLGVDATLQYIRGNKGAGFWAPITVADKKVNSLYNTYKRTGLPPHPIANPGLKAIEAVLNPTVTDCLYYLHDKERVTHCAVTYEEHQKNIEQYLKAPSISPQQ